MLVSLNVYAYLKFWNTPSIVFWSDIMFSSDVDVSSEGENGLKQPVQVEAANMINAATLYFRLLIGKSLYSAHEINC